MSDLRRELLNRLLDGMSERRLTQADVARAAGLSAKHVNQIIRGHISGSLEAWQAMFDTLDAPRAAVPKVCVLCGRSGRQRFIYEGGEFRCGDWNACRARQRRQGYRPVGGQPTTPGHP